MDDWRGKRILLVSAEGWGPVRLSKHHYATTLVEHGAKVFFLGPVERGLDRTTVEEDGMHGLAVVRGPRPTPGSRFLPRPVRAWMEARRLAAIARACGGGFDLLWNFDPYRFRSLRDRTHARRRLLHIMDLHAPTDLVEPARNADGVIVVSPSFRTAIAGTRTPVLHVPHGLAITARRCEAPVGLAPSPRIGYLGNLAIRQLHWASLLAIATDHPEATLYLIGPMGGTLGGDAPVDETSWRALRELPNVRWTGAVPHDRVPDWLAAMDVLLVAYDDKLSPLGTVNSHKVLEYLHSGKVVLASHLADCGELAHLMVMMDPGRSIAEGIGRVLRDLETLNAPERMAERRAFAEGRTYAAHLRTISSFIRELPGGA